MATIDYSHTVAANRVGSIPRLGSRHVRVSQEAGADAAAAPGAAARPQSQPIVYQKGLPLAPGDKILYWDRVRNTCFRSRLDDSLSEPSLFSVGSVATQ